MKYFHWKRYSMTKKAYIDPTKMKLLIMKLIDNQPSIQFTHEIEESQKTVFVDILIRGTEDSKINTTVFIKIYPYKTEYQMEA